MPVYFTFLLRTSQTLASDWSTERGWALWIVLPTPYLLFIFCIYVVFTSRRWSEHHYLLLDWNIWFKYFTLVAGCRLWRTDLLRQLQWTKVGHAGIRVAPIRRLKLTKLSLKNLLDKFPPPSFYKIRYRFIYYIYIYKPTHVYVSMCKNHTKSKQASIIRERIWTNAYSAQLSCSRILNFEWSEKVFLSIFWPSNSAAGKLSQAGHKDPILTISLKASGRFGTQGGKRQNEAAKTKKKTRFN